MGGASRWWLHNSLKALNDKLGGKLLVLKGDPVSLLSALAVASGAKKLYFCAYCLFLNSFCALAATHLWWGNRYAISGTSC